MAAHRVTSTSAFGAGGAGAAPGARAATRAVLGHEHTRADLERASRALVPYLVRFSRRMDKELRMERLYLTTEPEQAGIGYDPVRLRAELAEASRARRRVTHIGARPLPHARREIARLAMLVRRVPFDRISIGGDSLVVEVPPLRSSERAVRLPRFEIYLPAPDALRFPVCIRLVPGSNDAVHAAFTRYAGHGRCWGEAETLLETAKEQVDLSALVLAALAWARRNLAS